MAEINPPGFMQALATHRASTDRGVGNFLLAGSSASLSLKAIGGVHPSLGSALAVTQNGTPNMSINIGSGAVAIPGSENATQGTYFCYNDGTVNKTIAASSPTQPRKDAVVGQIFDSEYSGATNFWQLAIVTGTPAASPVLPTIPANTELVAEVNIAANATTITNANITSRHKYAAALGGIIPITSTTRPSISLTGKGTTAWETDTGKLITNNGTSWALNYVDPNNDTGAWVTFTPTTNGTLGNGTAAMRYKVFGKTMHWVYKFTFGSTSTIGNGSFTLPFNRLTSGGDGFQHIGHAFDTSAGTRTALYSFESGLATVQPLVISPSSSVSATVPFTWATGDLLMMSGTIEIA